MWNILEGAAAGLMVGGWIVCIGGLISGTWLGIAITVLLCITMGMTINGILGALAGLICGSVAGLIGDMVSQSHFGIGCTIFLCIVIGGITGWEVSQLQVHQLPQNTSTLPDV